MAGGRRSARFKQQYSANNISNQTAGRKNNSELTTAQGRYKGSRKAQTRQEGGLGHNAQWINREQAYRDMRHAFNDIHPTVARAMLDAGQITQAEYDRMYGSTGTGVAGNGTGGRGGRGMVTTGSSSGGKRGLGLSVG